MNTLRKTRAAAALLTAAITLLFVGNTQAETPTAIYKVEHSLSVKDLPKDAKTVRVWFWMPNDDDNQDTRSFTIEQAPEDYLIVREPTTGSRYLYAEVPADEAATFVTHFTVERRTSDRAIDPATVGPVSRAEREMYAEHLATDTPNMEVNGLVRRLADEICGNETNPLLQAQLIYNYVVDYSDHYSKGGDAPKSSGIGSADYCINLGGGGCTDQHSLFIALARAKGIPARLEFGSRLKPDNEGKEVDPGYRCWVQYYVPNHGWVSMDASAGDTVEGKRDFYNHGLDNQRIHFASGRNLQIGSESDRVNLIIGAYVEVDGKPHEGFDRRMIFNRIPAEQASKPGPSIVGNAAF